MKCSVVAYIKSDTDITKRTFVRSGSEKEDTYELHLCDLTEDELATIEYVLRGKCGDMVLDAMSTAEYEKKRRTQSYRHWLQSQGND